jgi:hypothetical protein
MSAGFYIKINDTDLKNVEKMLGNVQGAVPRVISRAINDTLAGVKTDASAEIRQVITLKKAAVDKTFRTVKSNVTTLSGLFESKGSPVPLIDYGARQTTKGVSVQVKRGNPRSQIEGAFIATMKSGHKGVFWRQWHTAARKPVNRNVPYGKLPKRYRLPIAQRFGPRVPDILENQPVMNAVLTKAGDRMHKNIDRELNYELSKL